MFEYFLNQFKQLDKGFADVDFNELDAPEDHLQINVTAAYAKLLKYYTLLADSPAYYAATILHPYYKYYFINSWTGELGESWLAKADAQFQLLWSTYKKDVAVNSSPRKRAREQY
jgi:hypothetical protein